MTTATSSMPLLPILFLWYKRTVTPAFVSPDDSVPASLLASPDVSQLFEYHPLSLSCGNNSRSHGWRIIRATKVDGKEGMLVNCSEKWGDASPSGCDIHTAKKTDSGVYWCESPARQRSNSLSISFYGTSHTNNCLSISFYGTSHNKKQVL